MGIAYYFLVAIDNQQALVLPYQGELMWLELRGCTIIGTVDFGPYHTHPLRTTPHFVTPLDCPRRAHQTRVAQMAI